MEGVFQDVEGPREGSGAASWSLPALIGFVGLGLLARAAAYGHAGDETALWLGSLNAPLWVLRGAISGHALSELYVLNGFAAWRVWRLGDLASLRSWGWQLLASIVWPLCLGLHAVGAATLALLGLLGLVSRTIWRFAESDRLAAALLIPYAAWIAYIGVAIAVIWSLN